jgi:hypothetical protein
MLNEKIIDLQTGEEVIRPYTAAEIKENEAAVKKFNEEAALKAEQEVKRQAAIDKLVVLGLTIDEAKALLA